MIIHLVLQQVPFLQRDRAGVLVQAAFAAVIDLIQAGVVVRILNEAQTHGSAHDVTVAEAQSLNRIGQRPAVLIQRRGAEIRAAAAAVVMAFLFGGVLVPAVRADRVFHHMIYAPLSENHLSSL